MGIESTKLSFHYQQHKMTHLTWRRNPLHYMGIITNDGKIIRKTWEHFPATIAET
jgi:hypothetical protein